MHAHRESSICLLFQQKKGNERKYELAAALQRSADPCFFLPIIQSTLYYYYYELEMLCSVNN